MTEQEARWTGEVAERMADDEVSAVVVAGRAKITGAVDASHLSREAEGCDVPHVGRPLAGVEDEQAVLLPEALHFVCRPLVEVLGEGDTGEPSRLRLLAQPLWRNVAVHRSDDGVDMHVDDGSHMWATIP